MSMLKALFAVIALSFSLNSLALTDEESLQFSDALTDGKLKVVQKFVKGEPTLVNEKTFGWSPLQMAANKNDMPMVKFLLSKGAEINYVHPIANHTAFHLATLGGMKDMMKLLASSGADVNVKLKGDVSLIRYFRDGNNTDMVELLTSLGAKDDGCMDEKCF